MELEVVGLVLVGLGLAGLAWVALRRLNRPVRPPQEAGWVSGLSPEEAKAIDPEDPPRWMTYTPTGDRESAPWCSCHHEPVRPGQRVVYWPIPNHPGVDLFCERAVNQAYPDFPHSQDRP